ncbi:conserved protein of unknown function [Petrocella atlantisensis]|uniref:Uncharacterized protein n=1 Tax=Petrocella atlantisensis TaxID=2173034 RepID=A0A3P7NWH6_9FIRM|nr:hypothetical protein [Petrocella atlantisensis]VDN47275.1 conserved protein of unknown function [Petrocella atlantisensis]
MLLYISSNENIGIFDFLADEQGMIIKKFNGSFQLKQFVIHDMRSLTHYAFLAIDLTALRDIEDEIIEAIMAFKSMYTSRVIFYVDKVEGNEQLIGQLMEQGIYNIVVSDHVEIQKEKIRKATGSLGMSKRDTLNLLNQEDSSLNNFRPDYRFLQKEVKVALTGVMSRVGTTTMAFNLCHFLSGLGAKACYVEANGSHHLAKIIEGAQNTITKGDTTIHNGICFMDLYGESDEEFDFIIYDMGVVESKVVGAIKNKCDVGILCGTAKPYEQDAYIKVNQLFDGIQVYRIFSFVHEAEHRKVTEEYGEGYFSDYTPSLFDSEKNSDMWMQILNIFIVRNTGIGRIYE